MPTVTFTLRAAGLVCMATLVLAVVPMDDASARQTDPDSALAVTLQQLEGVPLSLDDAIAMALERGTAVADARAALAAAQGGARFERGAFDPEAFATADLSRNEVPTASPFAGASVLVTDQLGTSSGLRSRLLSGGDVALTVQSVRSETNSIFSALNPQIVTYGELSLRQPLWSGAGISARGDLATARLSERAASDRLADMVLGTRAAVENLYWDLYAAERDYAVQQIIRDQARALLEETELRARAGLVGPSQVENARVFLAQQQLAALDREEGLDLISDALGTLMGFRPADGERFRPSDDPVEAFAILPVAELLTTTLDTNREIRALQAEVEAADVRLRAARRQQRPSVDLVGSLAANGLAGTGRDVIFGSDTLRVSNTGSSADALKQLLEFEFPRWTVGVDVTVPIGRRRQRGETERLKAERDRAAQRLEAATRSLEEAVRRHHRALSNGGRRLEIARSGVRASQEQVRIGLIEFRNGRSTAFELVRLGADLAAAEQRLSQSLVRNAKAVAALGRLTGQSVPSR